MGKFGKYAILISTMLLCGLMFLFFNNLRPRFTQVEEDYKHDRAINLSQETDPKKLSQILITNGYVSDPQDADFAADTIVARLKRGIEYPNLYHFQKRDYGKVPAAVVDSAGVFKEKLDFSLKLLGLNEMDSLTTQVANSHKVPIVTTPTINISKLDTIRKEGIGKITVHVYENEKKSRGKILDKLLPSKKVKKGCKDVFVCLKEYDADWEDQDDVVVYAKTDGNGFVTFTGLDTSKGYSVLPIKKGFEYGSSKGIVQHNYEEYKYLGRFIKNEYVFDFEQLEHRIQMIDNSTLKQIKNDGTITVRTPEAFKAEVIKMFVLMLLAWWVLVLVMHRRKRFFDPILIATAMFLTGLCVIVMYSIQNPLTEELKGTEMASGVLMGIGVVALLQLVDFVKLYQNRYKLDFDIPLAMLRWLFLPFKQKVAWLAPVLSGSSPWYKKFGAMLLMLLALPFVIFNIPAISKINKPILRLIDHLPKGFGWLLFAILLTALLWTPFGKEIGGMKVNLNLFGLTFQPSEIAKYLILFFMAAFFTQNADTIIAYSQANKTKLWDKTKTLGWVIGGLILLMGLYAILGDMGPALVIGVTFVLLYSLIKSKVNLDNLDEDDKWKRIFTCDFAMLIYGVLTFAVFLIVGYKLHNTVLFAGLWFLAWIFLGISYRKQFFETAFIINLLVFVFVFGGDVMKQIPALSDTDIAERFEQRTRMCSNTWGDLDIHLDVPGYEHGKEAEPVSNTQVANGLWAIATGGMTGQGLGDGNPNLIPAFHTDMILSSIGEQMGWIGLLLVVLILALLLRRMIVVGYRVGHPFAFYFCTGVAVVTAVQFFIIALGSSGMIPLTGITVPFLSYGRVSMILNLTALGIVLSLTKNIKQEEQTVAQEQVRQRSVGDYNYPVSIATWTYIFLALFTLCVWQHYALWRRGDTLTHPAYVHNNEGLPVIEYNPRIALLTREMWAGDIYDRNGVLLATSDKARIDTKKYVDFGIDEEYLKKITHTKTKRYYPFGDHLFFMLGDLNTGVYFAYDEKNPIGYMAEAQHLSYLRDYDNVKRDDKGQPVKVNLKGKVKGGRYVSTPVTDTITYVVRDNSDLIKYLKGGINGRAFKRHNKKVREEKFDLYLTLDAALQIEMQNQLMDHVSNSPALKNNNLLRISVVVLDAENGDLLTSANYPLPNQKRLLDEEKLSKSQGERYANYSDYYKDRKWMAYTDRDLGMTFATAPGSTAKVMSAMAGLNKLGVDKVRSEANFPVYRYEVIDIKDGNSKEPPMGTAFKADVSMKDAIVWSSNCYFINLVNHYNCYKELADIYSAVGLSLEGKRTYSLHYATLNSDVLNSIVSQTAMKAVPYYQKYISMRDANKLSDLGINVNKGKTMRRGDWMWAWGQGTMDATPLNMARVASAVVNNGRMPVTKYLLKTADKKKKEIKSEYVALTSKECAGELKSYMQAQAQKHDFPASIGGKTGTPERNRNISRRGKTVTNKSINDGWYVFFVETGNPQCPKLAVAVRMERIGGNSGMAMELAKSVVLESLSSSGYINKKN